MSIDFICKIFAIIFILKQWFFRKSKYRYLIQMNDFIYTNNFPNHEQNSSLIIFNYILLYLFYFVHLIILKYSDVCL